MKKKKTCKRPSQLLYPLDLKCDNMIKTDQVKGDQLNVNASGFNPDKMQWQ